ncbi:MAG: 30S ribosomal protein S6 [Candidatus Vogelbacteria bacterium]|nr:30S ribosomal protein S6 [Candidatus Vogelbacteria bacterium]
METEGTKLYELGYLLVPTLAEEAMVDEVNKIRAYLEKDGGLITSFCHPETKKLAYEIAERGVASKKTKFGDAFFGWFRFQSTPEAISNIKDELDKNSKVLRFLIIKPSKDSPRLTIVQIPETKTADASVKREKKKIMTEQELDKEIDELLVKETVVK